MGSLRPSFADAAELEQVAEMRQFLADDFSAALCGQWKDVTGDLRLLRFLRGYDNDVAKATAAVRDLLAIRKRYRLDEDYHEQYASLPCTHIAAFPHQDEINRFKPGLPTVGLSQDGCPICYEPLRLHRYGATLEEIGESGMLHFYLAQCESRNMQLHKLSEAAGAMVKMILVIDLRSVSLWQLTSRRWGKFDLEHLSPVNRTLAEILARVYIINTPGWAVGFFKRIKWWIPTKTQEKIRLLGTDYRGALLQVMDAKQIHSFVTADFGNAEGAEDGAAPADASDPALSTEEAAKGTGQEVATVGAGRVLERELLMSPGGTVSWRFALLSPGDIEFTLLGYPSSGALANGEGSGGADAPERGVEDEDFGIASVGRAEVVLIPKRRFAQSDGEVQGHCTVPVSFGSSSTGNDPSCLVVARWSNSHTWIRSKLLSLSIDGTEVNSRGSNEALVVDATAVHLRAVSSSSAPRAGPVTILSGRGA